MEFIVRRRSIDSDDVAPCGEAIRKPFERPPHSGEQWVIEIDSLEALMAFFDKYGDLVITTDTFSATPKIEIYDDWRE